MNKALLLSGALMLGVITSPAIANDAPVSRDRGFYLALGMGMAMNNDSDLDFGSGLTGDLAIDDDFAIAGAVGYRISPWLRIEGEIGHLGGDLGNGKIGGVATTAYSASVGAMTYMTNVYVDWQNSSRFTPYAGFGLGAATISIDLPAPNTLRSDDSETAFAWQIGAGVDYRITDKWQADLGWRYLETDDVTLNTTYSGTAYPVETSLSSNIIRAGIRYEF